jgi:hypothetical protein
MQRAAQAWKAFPLLRINPRSFHGLKPLFCETTWLDRYPFAKALMQQPDDELCYTPCWADLPEDREHERGLLQEVRQWEEDDI